MVCYGESVCLSSITRGFLKMPTAIITAYTPQGFFIAADGRSRYQRDGAWVIYKDDEQKIFRIADGRACFAYALTGTARFTAENDDADTIFDFNLAIPMVADRLRATPQVDSWSYCQRLAESVSELLGETVANARGQGKTVTYPDNLDVNFGGSMIAHLMLAGYYSGKPCQALFRFVPRNGNLAPVCELLQRFVVNDSRIQGSNEVARLLYESDDPNFSQFRFRPSAPGMFTFREWALLAKNYVAACESPAGLAADPELAPGIGGRVHAATVTPGRGFRWIPGFER